MVFQDLFCWTFWTFFWKKGVSKSLTVKTLFYVTGFGVTWIHNCHKSAFAITYFPFLSTPRLWQSCWQYVWGCFCSSPWFAASPPLPDLLPDSAGGAATTQSLQQPHPNIRCLRSALSSTWPSSKVPELGLAAEYCLLKVSWYFLSVWLFPVCLLILAGCNMSAFVYLCLLHATLLPKLQETKVLKNNKVESLQTWLQLLEKAMCQWNVE